MRILHVGKFYSPINGGIESINKFIVECFKGNDQKVVSFNDKRRTEVNNLDNAEIVRCSCYGIFASQPLSMSYFFRLRRELKKFKPDIVHFHYPNPLGALYLNLLIGKSLKLIVHWHSDVVAQTKLKRLIRPIEDKLLGRADAIIATSPNYVDSSENLRHFKDKIRVLPCSIDQKKFELVSEGYDDVQKLKNKYGNKPIVFFIGRHVEYKGLEFLLKAEQFVKSDCVFVIAGEGPLTASLKNKYNSNRIYWLGRLRDDDMKNFYHAASVFAFPSITRNEAFGVVLAEAMYCECPPITFTIPGSGVNWVSLRDVTGKEVENGDIKEYARAIDELLSNEKEREILALAGKKRVEDMFSKEKVSEKYIELYSKLMTASEKL